MRADDDELLEVFRLGKATGLGEITTTVGSRLAGRWLGVSRSREVATLMGRALHIEASPVVMNYAGRAAENLGYRGSALTHYEEALPLIRAVQDRAGEATTLTNIGAVHRARGDRAAALTFYEQALPLLRAVEDRTREAATRFNIAAVLAAQDATDLDEAIRQMEIVIDIDRAIGHPDLDSDQEVLNNLRRRQGTDT